MALGLRVPINKGQDSRFLRFLGLLRMRILTLGFETSPCRV